MTIPLQFASLYDRQEIFMWSNCLLDLLDFDDENDYEGNKDSYDDDNDDVDDDDDVL